MVTESLIMSTLKYVVDSVWNILVELGPWFFCNRGEVEELGL